VQTEEGNICLYKKNSLKNNCIKIFNTKPMKKLLLTAVLAAHMILTFGQTDQNYIVTTTTSPGNAPIPITHNGSMSISGTLQTGGVAVSNGTANRADFTLNAAGNLIINSSGRSVGIGNSAPTFNLDIEGSLRAKNSSTTLNSYTTFRLQGPNYANGLEVDFFGNDNIASDLNWSYGGGAGSVAIVNVNARPLTFGTNNKGRMWIDGNGNVGIGTNTPGSYMLAVAGKIAADGEVRVFNIGTTTFPDYVFDKDYQLPSLEETEKYVKENHHLPEVPSAAEVQKNGMSLNEMNVILLKKVEELTLHLIEMKKENELLKARIDKMEGKK
jgi:hypothetical protein